MNIKRLTLATALIIGAIGGPLTGVAQANDNRGTYICVTPGLPAQCADLKDDVFAPNQQIWLYGSSQGNGLGWNLASWEGGTVTDTWPFTVHSLDGRYESDPVYLIEKTTATGHDGCMGYDQYVDLSWQYCGDIGTVWVQSQYGYFINVDLSDVEGAPYGLYAPYTQNGDNIYIFNTDNPWYLN